jgi:[ribosomal protein S18]-alanine N-acetyltransferase
MGYPQLTIRLATTDDSSAIAALHSRCFETPWPHETIIDFVANDLVLVSGDDVHGFIIVRHIMDEAEILSLAVTSDQRQSGLGSRLVMAARERLHQMGIKRLFLEVAEDNHAARSLYERAGFRQIGLRKAYYKRATGPYCDAIIMAVDLTSHPIVTEN